jgi:Zn-dependent protease/CBS domain-containing protein
MCYEELMPVQHHRSKWSLELGSIANIPVRIHTTFFLLLAWLVLMTDSPSPMVEGLFVVSVFLCVLLHELGHAIMGKWWGIQTKHITLYPFGGIAAITSQPSPKGELFIAISGPLVNIAIAAIIYPWISVPSVESLNTTPISFVTRLFLTNIGLALFNLLPALPMDGGRVLRALLSLLNVRRPTFFAARISQGICILLGLAGLYLDQPMLFVIAFIIFFGAMQEHVRAETSSLAIAFTVSDVVIPKERLETMSHGTTISKGLRTALTSLQPLYPVMNGDELMGVVFREDLLEHAATRADDYIGEILTRSLPRLEASLSLADALTKLEEEGSNVAVVTRNGQYIGLLVADRLADFLLLQELRQNFPKDDDIEWSTPQ